MAALINLTKLFSTNVFWIQFDPRYRILYAQNNLSKLVSAVVIDVNVVNSMYMTSVMRFKIGKEKHC